MNPSQALADLNMWLKNNSFSETVASDWTISPYREAFLFTPSGSARSNTLYLVHGFNVVSFSPALMSVENAYTTLFDNPSSSVAAGKNSGGGNLCDVCGSRLAPVKYGKPGPEAIAQAERGEIILGGCNMPLPGDPARNAWRCPNCEPGANSFKFNI